MEETRSLHPEWYNILPEDEVHAILEKTRADLCALAGKDIENTVQGIESASIELGNLRAEILMAQDDLDVLEERIKSKREEADRLELEEMPSKYIDAFVRKQTKGLAPGDEVWVISHADVWSTCSFCHGNSKVVATIDGVEREIRCPECGGTGRTIKRTYSIAKRRVTDVNLTLCFSPNRVRCWKTTDVFMDDDKRYSLGSIYLTEEEAKEALKEMEE